jgi:mandelate racemase
VVGASADPDAVRDRLLGELRLLGSLTLDAMRVCGVAGWMHAAALARDHGVPVASHTFPEVSVHLLAATPTAAWLEHFDHLTPVRATPLHVRAGREAVPHVTGIGLEWDERAIRSLSRRQL